MPFGGDHAGRAERRQRHQLLAATAGASLLIGALLTLDVLPSADETIEDPTARQPHEALLDASEIERLHEFLADIDEVESEVLRLRYGLDNDGEGMTLKGIGKMMNLTREKVRQIERRALGKLQEWFLD